MKTKTILAELQEATNHSYALGAFNIFNYLSARAVIRGAQKLATPVILQTSVSTVKRFGPQELGTMLRQLAWNASVNVIVHLDHCTDIDLAKACCDAGWDSIMYDGSRLPLEENIKNCQEVVAYAHPRGICVEGELGRIGGVEDNISVSDDDITGATIDESLKFVSESGIDTFAPAIGTAHGQYKSSPRINFALVAELNRLLKDTPIVVHGGTGLDENTFRKLIRNGGAKINISTAIKHAYIDGCGDYLKENPNIVDPISFDQYLNCRIEDVAMNLMTIFRKDYLA